MRKMHGKLVLLIGKIIALSICRHSCAGDALSMIKSQCPFTTFCTEGPQQIFVDNAENTPCCVQCSCDAKCREFDTCCPDAIGTATEVGEHVTCQSNIFEYNHKLKLNIDHSLGKQYRIETSCPTSYTDEDTVIKCVNSSQILQESFDDIVIVSSVANHDHIYKNIHCAVCNGVMDVLRWNLEAFNCEPMLTSISIPRSELFDFYLTHCDIRSLPGSQIRLSLLSMCYENTISTCNETGLWDMYDEQMEKLCESSYSPYFERDNSVWLSHVTYQNVACFLCNSEDVTMFKDVCDEDGILASRGFDLTNLFDVLDFTLRRTNPNEIENRYWKCNEWEIFDNIMEMCRDLKCPPVASPSFGKCIPYAKVANGIFVELVIRLRTVESISVQEFKSHITDGHSSQMEMVTNRILKAMIIDQCTKYDMRGIIVKTKDGLRVVEILVKLKLVTNYLCQLQYIADRLAQFDATKSFTIKSAGIVINMIAHLDFSTDKSVFNSDVDFLSFYQIYRTQTYVSFNPNTMCPYIIMDMNEYIDYVEARMGSTYANLNINTAGNHNDSYMDDLLPGFFELNTDNETLVAGCVEHIWPNYDNSASCHNPRIVLLILLCTILMQFL